MDDLIAFIKARLDEDEAIAAAGGAWSADTEGNLFDRTAGGYLATGPYGCGIDSEALTHIARHDPARALRDVAAKRAILARWQEANASRYECAEHEARAWLMDAVVTDLAAVWSGHPGYRQELEA